MPNRKSAAKHERRRFLMKNLVVAVLCVLIPVSAFADSASYKVSYDGGSITEKTGNYGKSLYRCKPNTVGEKGRRAGNHTSISHNRDQLRSGCSPSCGGRHRAGRRKSWNWRSYVVKQVEEALCRHYMGGRRQEGRIRHAMRQERLSRRPAWP